MAYAKRTYTPGSSTTTFALTTSGGSPIGYIQESDITVKVNGTTYTNAASGTNTYQISGSSTVEQPNGGNVVLNAGVTGTVILERVTAFQDATVVYTAGSTLTSTDLNNADNQIRFSLQEFDDKYAALTSGTGDLDDIGGFLGSGDTWVSNNSKAPTTGAVDGRVDTKVATALTGDVVATAPVTIADNSPSSGKITLAVDAKLTELSTMAQATANALADLTQSEVEILDGITATTAEINYVDGVTSNVQTQLDAKQGSATDLTTLSSCQTNAASALAALTQAEVQILDGATVSTGELNVLDGIPNTLSATELGYVDGVTSSIQTQLNAKQPLDAELTELATMSSGTASSLADLTGTEAAILDGATLTVTELNYVDGVTSAIQTQLDAKQPLDSELTTLAGMQGGTASILASGTALGATTTEINSICENRASQTTITDDDAKIPTSGAVVDYVAAQIAPIGGLEVVATEVAFPNTQPASGVVISISDAGGVVVNGSGVSTTGRTVGSSTVTINGFPSSLYSETLAAGVGLMVSSTGSSQTYTYHKLLAKEGDVKQLSDDINDFNERYRVSNGAPSGTDHAGDLYYDTGSDKMLVRNAANNAWEEVQSIGNFYISTLSPAFNGSLEDFTVSNAPSNAQQLLISINGILQKPNSGTSRPSEGFALNGSTVLFSDPPATGSDYFVVVIGSAVNIGTPSNNTVSEAILQNNQVSEEKLKVSNSPTNGQFLQAQSGTSGGLTWANATSDLVNDTSPQLGGDLDVNGNSIVSTSNGNIDIDPNGTGDIVLQTTTGAKTQLNGAGGDVQFVSGVTNAICQWDYSEYQLEFWDNVKASFGSDADLNLYHDGSHGYLTNSTGDLKITDTSAMILATNSLRLRNGASDETYLAADNGGGVELYYNNAKVFYTTAAGAILKRPSGGASQFEIYGCEGNDAELRLISDDGDDNDDFYKLVAKTNHDFAIENFRNGSSWETNLTCTGDGAVDLYHNNVKKLATFADGVKVYEDIDLIGSTPQIKFDDTTGSGYQHTINTDNNELRIFASAGGFGVYTGTNDAGWNNTTRRLYVDGTGKTTLTGNLAFANTQGIDFSAQTASSHTGATTGSELLDHYEEGSFTPILNFGGIGVPAYNASTNGTYTRIGDTVHFRAYVMLSDKGSNTGTALMYGLPFNNSSGSRYTAVATWCTNMEIGDPHTLLAYVGNNTEYVVLQRYTTNGDASNLNGTHFNDNSEFMVSGTYQIS